jgi:hypothetical protein
MRRTSLQKKVDNKSIHGFIGSLINTNVTLAKQQRVFHDQLDTKCTQPISNQRQSLLIRLVRLKSVNIFNIWVHQALAEMDGEEMRCTQVDPSAQEPGHALGCGRINEACEKTIERGNFRLTTLLAQAELASEFESLNLDIHTLKACTLTFKL